MPLGALAGYEMLGDEKAGAENQGQQQAKSRGGPKEENTGETSQG
jgi:hypothetical protein